MPVQQNINIVWRLIGWNVLKTEFQSTADKIDDQWPFKIAVAISADENDARADRAQLVEDRFRANIPKMPDFVCISGYFLHFFRQTIVRVRQDENSQRLFRFLWLYHSSKT
jgi:hypothetical protein